MKIKDTLRLIISIFVVIMIVVGFVTFQTHKSTRHIIETPPQTVMLHSGVNNLVFPVQQGNYLLRVGAQNINPSNFGFAINGTIVTQSYTRQINKRSIPSNTSLKENINYGYVLEYIDIKEKTGSVSIMLNVSQPEGKILTCEFFGIK
jgi:hypothetical protein